jgi:ribosomal protein S18 acetylase RimI-like enzyme
MAHLETVDAEAFAAIASDAAHVYGAAMKRTPEIVVQRRELICTHVRYAGFIAAGIFDEAADSTRRTLLGFGYGYSGIPGQWWHDIVATALGPQGTTRWLRDSFELAELHVLPAHQGRGYGGQLLADVISRVPSAHVVLSTPDVESTARALYRSRGFTDLRCGFRFPGSPEDYAIMGRDL